MNLGFLTVFINIFVLILLGVPGYIFRKLNILREKDSKPLVLLLIYVTQPFLIIMCFQGKQYSPDILGSIFQMFIFSVAIHLIILLLAKLIFDRFNIKKDIKGVFIFASAFSNCGYIGIPVINSLFRGSIDLSEMLIYVSIYIAVFNIINWTIGIYIISGDKKYMSLKNAIINPSTIAILIALPMFFTGFNLNDKFYELAAAFKMFGDMTTPLSMTIIGIKLAEMPFKQIFSDKYVYLNSFIKLIIMPIIMLLILQIFAGHINILVKYVIVIVAAMPVATLTVVNTEKFGGDSNTATKSMLCSTLLSILTIPLICMLF